MHALLSPSAASRWLNCPGSLALCATLPPEQQSKHAELGTLAHELARLALLRGADPDGWLGERLIEGSPLAVDEEMVRAVGQYLASLRLEYGLTKDNALIETRLDLSEVLGVPDSFGTADAIITRGNELQVHDLKYGTGVKVEARDNPQLMLYALGARRLVECVASVRTVRLVIHQPRLDHISEATYSALGMDEWAKYFRAGARRAVRLVSAKGSKQDDILAHLVPGDKQCRWCPARAGHCPALTAKIQAEVLSHFEEGSKDANLPNAPKELRRLYDLIPLIKIFYRAVEARIEEELLAGRPVEGLKLVEGRKGARQWTDAKTAEQLLLAAGVEPGAMYDLKSPTQIEKAAGKVAYKAVEKLVTQPEGHPVVAPAEDPRPPIAAVTDSFEALK